ncbi:MAG: hypothetical protein HYX84_08290 [Chloroflexi bacterium]|nr:hypothetical protein [Chloroflexota bacterium]
MTIRRRAPAAAAGTVTAAASKTITQELAPDRKPITQLQAQRLALMAGLDSTELKGISVADISEKFKWKVDLELLMFRRICGRVIKRDPVTGVEHPVPFATVHVEDTDCNFLGFFPGGWPWVWLFPFGCRREEIATVVTDACGRFCVWIPRWEVDWILRFRRERICFPDIFVRPNIRDLLDDLLPKPPIIRQPPLPDPPPDPFLLKNGGIPLMQTEAMVGRHFAQRLGALEAGGVLGSNTSEMTSLLGSNGFSQSLPPPLPSEFKELRAASERQPKARISAVDMAALSGDEALAEGLTGAARENIAVRLNTNVKTLADMSFRHFIGPFRRCVDVLVPEFQLIMDVPDITFRVTQDVDGDGDQETIYSESFFDVRWNSGPIPDVMLEASQIALAGPTCNPPLVPCDGAPAITHVGRMPLINPALPADPYHDSATGYARRPNRPHPSGNLADPMPNPLASSPYTRVLQLYGCHHVAGASFYRLRYAFNGGATVPFAGLTWPLTRLVGGVMQVMWATPDAAGWYPILPEADHWFPEHLLLDWPTQQFQDGLYQIELQLGNAAKAVIHTTAPIGIRVDNQDVAAPLDPLGQFTGLAWRVAGGGAWIPLPLFCPMVTRPSVGGVQVNIEIRVSYLASATHLRSIILSGGGCGGLAPSQLPAPNWSDPPGPTNPYEHWHTDAADNSVAASAVFALPGAAPQGAYHFSLNVHSRAFNPSGGDGGQLADWNYDPVYNWVYPSVGLAIVNG